MAQVLPARPEMLDGICRLHFGPQTSESDRERIRSGHAAILSTPWHREERPAGYVLSEAGSIHGFIGAFYSRRTIRGQDRLFCNLSYWMVAEGHRSQGLRLMMPFLTDPNLTLTGFTASATAYGIYQRLGFKPLDQGVRIVPNIPWLHRWRPGIRVISDPAKIQTDAEWDAGRICRDHAHLDCWHLLATDGRQSCFLLYTLTHKRRQPMAYLHHVSDPKAFSRFRETIKLALWRRHGFLFFACEERLLGGEAPRCSIRFPLQVPRIYRGEDIAPKEIDSAYTELIAVGPFRNYFY